MTFNISPFLPQRKWTDSLKLESILINESEPQIIKEAANH